MGFNSCVADRRSTVSHAGAQNIDVVLLDLKLPGQWSEALHQIRRVVRMRDVVVTGYGYSQSACRP